MLLDELRELGDPEQDNVCFSVIKVELQGAESDDNIFAPEFERRENRPLRVRTRPVKPQELPETEEAAAKAPPPGVSNGVANGKGGKDSTPIFLRRRWLATDGGA